MNQKCPLCHSNPEHHHPVKGPLERRYLHCPVCDLVFVACHNLLPVNAEKERYEQHENDVDDPGYLKFLNQAVEPTLPFLSTEMTGLDYGCGPGPAICQILAKQRIECQNYDPIFGPALPQGPFDFIFSTEVFEHFHDPEKELRQLDALLKPGGILTVMTMFRPAPGDFENWFYARDDTHVLFYTMKTFEFIASRFRYDMMWNDETRVVILKKRNENKF
ncbi:class I SAM-dependent methyltransferase [Marinilabilia rubra]|uniref:Class I SAM-dependent methyltransferase n=1 Tax=Marinilabilia rubra TaxID=2162893 RepID=A0A2U2BBQ2_9BACT|nr:class I SAM-dependent methyltransferase [Marinilabilia rubra]PWE00505.1 class I SAM-dependent methyltransferase [Marinilabilia rubra]